MDLTWQTFLGTALGSGLAVAVIRYFVLNLIADLKKLAELVPQILTKMSVFDVELKQMLDTVNDVRKEQSKQIEKIEVRIEKIEQTELSHERQIIEIQTRLKYDRPLPNNLAGQAGMRPSPS